MSSGRGRSSYFIPQCGHVKSEATSVASSPEASQAEAVEGWPAAAGTAFIIPSLKSSCAEDSAAESFGKTAVWTSTSTFSTAGEGSPAPPGVESAAAGAEGDINR